MIYIKATRQVVGSVEDLNRADAEIANIVNSELGGGATDYDVTLVNAPSIQRGMVYQVDATKSITLVPNPVLSASQAVRASAKQKLLNLGFTPQEVGTIFQ